MALTYFRAVASELLNSLIANSSVSARDQRDLSR